MNLLGNIGTTEIVLILLLALIVLGPEKLPEMARKVGTVLRDLRRMYANLSKDLGPELSSLPQAIQEVRQTADAFKALPREAIRTLSQAAEEAGSPAPVAPEVAARIDPRAPGVAGSPGPAPAPVPAEAAGAAQTEEPGV